MIRSMTGYGRGQFTDEKRDVLVEIRSVNNRYYDFSARVPRAYGYLEEKLKSFVQNSVSRGKVEVFVSVFNNSDSDENISVSLAVAQGYVNALRKANEQLGLNDDLSLSLVLRMPDAFLVKKEIEDEETVWASVKPAAEEALAKFVAMRETEGRRMVDDVLSKLTVIEEKVSEVEKLSPQTVENYRNRLYTKLCEILEDKNIDQTRILTEAAIFSEKVAVDEETVRLRSHISQFRSMVKSGEPIGRKLDFLVQEMNREANTIGSKAQEIEITRIVVDIKSEIEKIREQIQNIE